jgi:hypothetical protein
MLKAKALAPHSPKITLEGSFLPQRPSVLNPKTLSGYAMEPSISSNQYVLCGVWIQCSPNSVILSEAKDLLLHIDPLNSP